MAILTKRETWAKPRPQNETRRSSDLTPNEQKNVRAAIRFLAKRHGTYATLAKAMGANVATVKCACRNGVSAGVALRAARVAGVALEELLAGRWPPVGACPHCGRA